MINLKRFKNFSIIIVPDDTHENSRAMKISLNSVLLYSLIYTLIIFLLGFYLISFSPLGELMLPKSLRISDSDIQRINKLNERIIYLDQEIEKLRSVNSRLRNAILLGDSTISFPQNNKKNSETKVEKKLPIEGNLISIVLDFLRGFNFSSTQDYISFIKPVTGYISRKFDPMNGHFGSDFVVKENSPIFASAGGHILFADYTPDYGYTLIINHDKNYVTKYLHCSALLKKEGDTVTQGETIALSGNSGRKSSGPHLHFEIWHNGKAIDPEKILLKF